MCEQQQEKQNQRHSAGPLGPAAKPEPGKYLSQSGVSNIYISPKTSSKYDEVSEIASSLNILKQDSLSSHVPSKLNSVSVVGVNPSAPPLKCERHQLEKCVLCQLFSTGEIGANSVVPPSVSSVHGKSKDVLAKGGEVREEISFQPTSKCFSEQSSRSLSLDNPNARCAAHDLNGCLICRIKMESSISNSHGGYQHALQYVRPQVELSPAISRVYEKNPALTVPLSDEEYIKNSIGRVGLEKFEMARQQYEVQKSSKATYLIVPTSMLSSSFVCAFCVISSILILFTIRKECPHARRRAP